MTAVEALLCGMTTWRSRAGQAVMTAWLGLVMAGSLAAVYGAIFGLFWTLDAVGLGKAIFDPPRPTAVQAHLRLAEATYDDLSGSSGCLTDCRGHEAGVRWAKAHEIADPADCGGRSRSFVEGCWAYAEAVVRITG